MDSTQKPLSWTNLLEDYIKKGKGMMYYSNGDRYEGEWNNDMKNGEGTMYYKNGKIELDWQHLTSVEFNGLNEITEDTADYSIEDLEECE